MPPTDISKSREDDKTEEPREPTQSRDCDSEEKQKRDQGTIDRRGV